MGPPLRGARRCAQRARSAALARRRGAVCHRRPPVVAAAGAESARGPVGSGAVRREPPRVTRPGVDGRSGAARPGAGAPARAAGGTVPRGRVGPSCGSAPGHGVRARRLGGGHAGEPAHSRHRLDSARSRRARGRAARRATRRADRRARTHAARVPLPLRRRALVATVGRRALHRPLGAGALVRLGFQLDRKDVRSAGLAVAAGAGLKIVLYDLSNLDALYRIASFFALALIALAVAYAYNRKAATSSRNV